MRSGASSGTWVRAVGRTADGGSWRAIVVPDGAARTSTAPLEREPRQPARGLRLLAREARLRPRGEREQPLRVERVPEGAVL